MTGSSARTLRRGGVNLLGGRARILRLHPLTAYELGEAFDLQAAPTRGTRQSKRRKAIASSKYYFFDIGVAGALQERRVLPGTREFGEAFETLVMNELVSWRDYVSGEPLAYWRSTSDFEVDFLIGDHTAIEVKATAAASPHDVRSLRALADERVFERLLLVCLEPRVRHVGDVTILPFEVFVERLWASEFTS